MVQRVIPIPDTVFWLALGCQPLPRTFSRFPSFQTPPIVPTVTFQYDSLSHACRRLHASLLFRQDVAGAKLLTGPLRHQHSGRGQGIFKELEGAQPREGCRGDEGGALLREGSRGKERELGVAADRGNAAEVAPDSDGAVAPTDAGAAVPAESITVDIATLGIIPDGDTIGQLVPGTPAQGSKVRPTPCRRCAHGFRGLADMFVRAGRAHAGRAAQVLHRGDVLLSINGADVEPFVKSGGNVLGLLRGMGHVGEVPDAPDTSRYS